MKSRMMKMKRANKSFFMIKGQNEHFSQPQSEVKGLLRFQNLTVNYFTFTALRSADKFSNE